MSPKCHWNGCDKREVEPVEISLVDPVGKVSDGTYALLCAEHRSALVAMLKRKAQAA